MPPIMTDEAEAGDRLNPGGSAPELTVHVNGAVPPTPLMLAL